MCLTWLSRVAFYPYNDAVFISAGHLLVLPAWLPILLLSAKDTLIFFQKKNPCASDRAVLCLLGKSKNGYDLGLASPFLWSQAWTGMDM